jgi:hypothetical protein
VEILDKPLAFRSNVDNLRLGGAPILVYEEGSDIPVNYEPHSYKHIGKPFLRKGLPPLEWSAGTEKSSISQLAECHCFDIGLMVSPRIRSVIESYDDTNIEFIPLRVKQMKTGKHLADWWYCNVFNWKDAFDFEKTIGEWVEFPEFRDTYKGSLHLIREFSDKILINIKKLEVLPSALEGGLFLARGPTDKICLRLFVGHELGREIVAKVNETAPFIDQIRLEIFDPVDKPNRLQPPRMPSEVHLHEPPPVKDAPKLVSWLKAKLGRLGAQHQK